MGYHEICNLKFVIKNSGLNPFPFRCSKSIARLLAKFIAENNERNYFVCVPKQIQCNGSSVVDNRDVCYIIIINRIVSLLPPTDIY